MNSSNNKENSNIRNQSGNQYIQFMAVPNQDNFPNNSFQSILHESFISAQNFHDTIHNKQFDNENSDDQSHIQNHKHSKNTQKKNFIVCFRQETIIEFYNAYLPLMQLLPYITKIQKIYLYYHRKIYKRNHDKISALPMPYPIQSQLEKLVTAVRQVIFISQRKYEAFLKFKLSSVLYDWTQLVHLMLEVSDNDQKQIQIRTQDRCQRRQNIKQIIKVIYTNIRYMIDYIELNEETFYYLRKDLTKYLMPRMKYMKLDNQSRITKKSNLNGTLKSSTGGDEGTMKLDYSSKQKKMKLDDILDKIEQNDDNISEYEEPKAESNITKLFYVMNSDKISKCHFKQLFYNFEVSLKSLYSTFVYHNEQKTHQLQAYSTITKKIESHKNHFLMGLYIGLGSITLIALLILLVFNLVELDYDEKRVDSMNYIFPMFRGIGLFIMYLWGMAWNVYGFTQFRINHRLVLQYGSHYSTHFQIMKRAGFFTLVFSSMLLIYCVVESLSKNKVGHQGHSLVGYAPFVVWVLYFSYIFFPNRDVFNPKGRRYFYDLLKKIIFSPALKITFLITWASDQAVSFVIPFKDFAYTICFYTSEIKLDSAKECLNAAHVEGVLVTYVVAILPLFLRMIQCYKQATQQSGKFVGHIQFWNFFKYFSSVLTATISYLSTIESSFFVVFIISSVISTSYSYYWDLKNDWGFFQKNTKHRFLRNHLSYKNPNFYYIAIVINLIFRCSWTLTISPSIVTYFHKSTFLPFLTGVIEILRRCMWNFFRVEKEHLVNCQDYVIMRPQVDKIIQKLKKKGRQSKIEAFQPHDEAYLGYNRRVQQSFVDQLADSLNLPSYFGQQQYEQEWSNIDQAKVTVKKKEFLKLRQKQKIIFSQSQKILQEKHPQLEQSVY